MKDLGSARDVQVRFAVTATLTKEEAFSVCVACAVVERRLRSLGSSTEAARWMELRESIEVRLAVPADPDRDRTSGAVPLVSRENPSERLGWPRSRGRGPSRSPTTPSPGAG